NNPLFSAQPAVAADGTLAFTVAANANGSATVSVYLKDNGGTDNGGADTTATQTFLITVTAVNDAPTFDIGGSQTVLEDAGAQTVPAFASNFSKGPADESGQTLTVTTTNTNNGLFSAQPSVDLASGNLTYTPAANANGSATVSVKLMDNGGVLNGGVDFTTKTFTITVTAVNDAPSFVKGADVTVLEDAAAYSAAWATAISKGPADEAGQTLTFFVSNNNNPLFSAQPAVAADGTLAFTVAANANGSATVSVYLKDNGGTDNGGVDTTATKTFLITVTAVNDPPVATADARATLEDTPLTFLASSLLSNDTAGPADESGQTLAVTAVAATANTFGAVALNAGNVTYTPALNYNGPASFQYTVCDNGATNGGPDPRCSSGVVNVAVAPVNDPPVITSITGPTGPLAAPSTATLTANFSDPDIGDTHTCTFSWDNSPTPTTTAGTVTDGTSGSCTSSFQYTVAGVYSVTVTVKDVALASVTSVYEFVVVYDPNAGFVTGGGWINSPVGAYKANPSLTGKANFGFVS
ncbi:MAG: tandem-95 repeat protein, partial [Gammaproteobacteria bacterium]|nr:tandem-95 repeat protein [Gammaproteobacteria bacterium]